MDSEGSVLTIAGNQMNSNILAGHRLRITMIVLGDGMAPGGVPLAELTGLVSPKKEIMAHPPDTSVPGQVMYRASMSNVGLAEPLTVREIGLFGMTYLPGEAGDELVTHEEAMYLYIPAYQQPDYIPADGGRVPTERRYDIIIIADNGQVDVYLKSGVYMLLEDMWQYSLVGHVHAIPDVIGLPEWMAGMEQRMGNVESQLSNDMIGADVLIWSFDDINDFAVVEGIHDPINRTIIAGGVV